MLSLDEWNVWYRTRSGTDIEPIGWPQAPHLLEEIYNFEDALAMGMFFNTFFRNADIVKMANLAQMVNVIAPIMTNEKGLYLQPIYFPIAEYGRQRGNTALNVWVSSPAYRIPQRPQEAKYLDVSATYNSRERLVYLNILNRSKDKDIVTRIENQGGEIRSELGVWEMNHPDLKATHTFGDDKKVRPIERTVSTSVKNNEFNYTFPAHSLTILRVRLK